MKTMMAWVWCGVLFIGLAALGQPAASPVAIPTTDSAAISLAETLWNFAVTKQWAMAIGPAIALIVYALRKWDHPLLTLLKLPGAADKIDAALNQPLVAFLLPTLIAALGGFGTALAAGKPPIEAVKSVLEAAMAAVFTYVGLKKAGEQAAVGVAAGAAIDTKAKAIDELKSDAKK